QPRWTRADQRVDAVRGQVAVQRGPVVMCLESPTLGADVATALVVTVCEPVDSGPEVLVPVRTVDLADTAWPYGPDGHDDGVSSRGDGAAAGAGRLVPLVPYHSWGNRGPSTMRVWMPAAGE